MNTRQREVFFLVLLLALSVTVRSQDDRVKRISGETADGLSFMAWTKSFVVPFGQNIVINYEVRNRGSKPVYLVHKDGPLEIRVEEDIHTLFIEAPVPLPTHHGTFNYGFIQVPKGKSHRGRFIIIPDQYRSAAYWQIGVGFGYVTDITGLEKKSGSEDDPGSRALLRSRMGDLGLGYLNVEVKKP